MDCFGCPFCIIKKARFATCAPQTAISRKPRYAAFIMPAGTDDANIDKKLLTY
jgi:hypothetical protein